MTLRAPLASLIHLGRPSAAPIGGSGRARRRERKGKGAPLVVAAIAALILLASVPPSHAAAPIRGPHPLGALPLSPRGNTFRPASMGLSAAPDAVAAQGAPSPTYDEQLGITFTQDFSSLEYNVSALAQASPDGYGPGYLLNGLTPEGYWYQVGI